MSRLRPSLLPFALLLMCAFGSQAYAASKPALALSQDKVSLLQGGTLSLRLDVRREADLNQVLTLNFTGLPAGVSVSPTTIPAGAVSTELRFFAVASAPHSLPTTVAIAASTAGFIANTKLTVTVRGAAGAVDTSFAGGQVVTAVGPSEDYTNALTVQADGKLLAAGASASNVGTRIALVRYLRDGAIDTSFGVKGRVFTAVGAKHNDSATAIALQADGKIVVAGSSAGANNLDFAVARYLPNGTLDSSFGKGGRVTTDFDGMDDRAWTVLIQPDGKILTAGESSRGASTTGVDFALARYNVEGTPDASFGSDGKVITAMVKGGGADSVRALALQIVDGEARILAIGGEGDFAAARYTAAGSLDAGFGKSGKVLGLFNSNIGGARAVTVLPDNTILLAGHANHNFAALQLQANGAPDTRFGPKHDGRVVIEVSKNNWDEATALARQEDGKYLLGGWAFSGNSSAGDFAAIRLNPNGALDPNFAETGIRIVAVAPTVKSDLAHALVLQPDERIPAARAVLAGEANSSNFDSALLRLWL